MPDASSKQVGPDTRTIQRAIWIVLISLVVVLLAFAGYYIWDRFIHLGDRSPVELGIERIEEAVAEAPQDPEARLALAESYLAAGQYLAARDQATQILNLYPENEGAQLIAGLASVRLGEPETAISPLESFVALRQDRPMARTDTVLETAYYFLGESYLNLDRPDDAIRVLEAALEISPTDADALYQLGLAHYAVGQPEIALKRYQGAVRFVPDFAEAYQGMIDCYVALGQADQEAYARGMEAFSLGDYDSAVPYLEQAAESLPGFAPAFLGLGLASERSGQLETALAAIQRTLELTPSDFAAQQALGRIEAALDSQK